MRALTLLPRMAHSHEKLGPWPPMPHFPTMLRGASSPPLLRRWHRETDHSASVRTTAQGPTRYKTCRLRDPSGTRGWHLSLVVRMGTVARYARGHQYDLGVVRFGPAKAFSGRSRHGGSRALGLGLAHGHAGQPCGPASSASRDWLDKANPG